MGFSTIELPRHGLIFTPSFEAQIKAGTASVSFDQKTNRLTMHFGRARLPLSGGSMSGFSLNGSTPAARPRLRR